MALLKQNRPAWDSGRLAEGAREKALAMESDMSDACQPGHAVANTSQGVRALACNSTTTDVMSERLDGIKV